MLPNVLRGSLLPETGAIILIITSTLLIIESVDAKDHKPRDPLQKGQNLCIARFESTTGEPLYYTCPRPNESEKKSYCCYLDKCCDYKEFQKQTEQQFKMTQAVNFGYMSKTAIGGVLKVLLWIVFVVILLIIGCCCLVFLLCRKRKLFSGGVFSTPLPTQPPGVNIYQRPNQPYDMVESIGPGAAPPVPPPSYPAAYPAYPPYPSGPQQPPFNPNFK